MKKRILVFIMVALALCCNVIAMPENFGVVVHAEGESNKKLVKATIGDHLEDDLVYTYRSSEGTYAFNPIDENETKGADLVMNEVGTRTNMMPVGQGYGPCQGDQINGMHYSIMKFQLDQNIKDIYWDYACLDLTPIYSTVGYNDGFILEAYLVDDYDMNTLTYNSFPNQIEGSPMVEINPGRGNAFEATRCDVTELINWAVEKGMTNINIKFVRSDKSPINKQAVFLCTERYTNPNYPDTDFTPTLRLLEAHKELVTASIGDHLEDDLVYTLLLPTFFVQNQTTDFVRF